MDAEAHRSHRHRRTAGVIGLGAAAVVIWMLLGAEPAEAQADGEALYRQNCSSCHGATGAGVPGLFPPLAGNPHVDDAAFVAGVIRNGQSGPIEVLGSTYDGQMPAFATLTDDEIDAIIGHLQTALPDTGAPTTTTLPSPTTTTLPSPTEMQADGEALFRQNCSSCHGATGAGVPGLFPPLAGNPHVDDAAFVAGVIRNGQSGPIEVLGSTYDGQMPAFATLTDDEIDAIIGHLQTALPDTGAPTTTTLPPIALPPVAGGAVLGERLFVGRVALEAGGPPCAACHAAGKYGDLSGGDAGLASDLSGLWSRTGDAETLAAAVRQADASAMHAVYADRPLTGEELSALASFFEEGAGEPRTEFLDGLALIGAALLLVLIAATVLVTARRRKRAGEEAS